MDTISGLVFDTAKEDLEFRAGIPRQLLLVRSKGLGGQGDSGSQASGSCGLPPGDPRILLPTRVKSPPGLTAGLHGLQRTVALHVMWDPKSQGCCADSPLSICRRGGSTKSRGQESHRFGTQAHVGATRWRCWLLMPRVLLWRPGPGREVLVDFGPGLTSVFPAGGRHGCCDEIKCLSEDPC